MKIDYVSDLHLDFYLHTGNEQEILAFINNELKLDNRGDVIVLAGDISYVNNETILFLEKLSEIYKEVLMVFGNHDYYILENRSHYNKDSKNRVDEIKDYFKNYSHIHILDRNVVEIDGIVFAGWSNWYSLCDKKTLAYWEEVSNDSKYILPSYRNKLTSTFIFEKDDFFYDNLGDVDVLISHIPPIHFPGNPFEENKLFYNPKSEIKGKYWICGHQHTVCDTIIGDNCRVLCNPIGYPGECAWTSVKQFEI